MVNLEGKLDQVFGALSSATRRNILARLEQVDDQSISSLAAPLGMKLPAMLKQLGVLESAQLITRKKFGRTVRVRLAAKPLAGATAWLERYERFWPKRLDRLALVAEQMQRKLGQAEA